MWTKFTHAWFHDRIFSINFGLFCFLQKSYADLNLIVIQKLMYIHDILMPAYVLVHLGGCMHTYTLLWFAYTDR